MGANKFRKNDESFGWHDLAEWNVGYQLWRHDINIIAANFKIYKGETILETYLLGKKGGMKPLAGKVHVALSDTLKASHFQHFLEGLLARYMNLGKILLILDNARAHHSKELEPFLEANKEKLELLFLPPYSPDLNPMEWFWKFLRKQVTHNTFFDTFKKFQLALIKFIIRFKFSSIEIKTRCSFAKLIPSYK